MEILTCTNRIKNHTGKIVGYYLVNSNNTELFKLNTSVLKELMGEDSVGVSNLRLTADKRIIIDGTEPQDNIIPKEFPIEVVIDNKCHHL